MADILIRKIDESTKELLRRRAERHGKSLEADLRESLERLAHEEAESPDDTMPFGDWAVAISRPGYEEFHELLEQLRRSPERTAKSE